MNEFDYVPILKLKRGEVTALSTLKDDEKARILPLLQVVFSGPRKNAKTKDREEKLASIVDKFLNTRLPEFPDWLNEARGKYPFILDFTMIYVESAREKAMDYLLENCHKNGQKLGISINVNDTQEYQKLVFGYIKKYGYGLCIRVSRPDLNDINSLNKKLEQMASESGLKQSQINLLVDIREENDDEKYTAYFEASQKIASINNWQRFIFANGVFPESMAGFKSGREHDIPRTDWLRFNIACLNKANNRKPIYADYATRYPIYDPESEKHSPTPAIKYTTDNNWHVMKGMGTDYGYYFGYSLAIVSNKMLYCGKDHCEGDKMLNDKAEKAKKYFTKRAMKKGNKIPADGVGSSEDWISMSLSHHMTVTLGQLANRS